MTPERQTLIDRAGGLNAAATALTVALDAALSSSRALREGALASDELASARQLATYIATRADDREVLHEQLPTIEGLAQGDVLLGRETAALMYVDEMATAFLRTSEKLKARTELLLLPDIVERLPTAVTAPAREAVRHADDAIAHLVWEKYWNVRIHWRLRAHPHPTFTHTQGLFEGIKRAGMAMDCKTLLA